MARSIAGRAMFFTLIRSRERPDGAVGALDVLAQPDAIGGAGEQLCQQRSASVPPLPSRVLAVELQTLERFPVRGLITNCV